MRAIIYERYGSPEVLELREVPKPVPARKEVLIRILAAEATKSDCELRSFQFAVNWFYLPLRLFWGWRKPRRKVLGGYFCGRVEALGEAAEGFQIGEEVFGSSGLRMGAYGEFACIPDHYPVVPKPKNASFEQAASIPLGGFNALHFMRRANIQPGEHVLVNGAGGSIGAYAVQIAKAMGAEVTAVDSSIKEGLLRSLGVDQFLDYTRTDFTTSGQKYDVILGMVAGASFSRCLRALRPGGRYLMANPKLSDMLRSLVRFSFGGRSVVTAFAAESKKELLALKEMAESGQIRPVVDSTYPLSEVALAHARVETEARCGPVVIRVAH